MFTKLQVQSEPTDVMQRPKIIYQWLAKKAGKENSDEDLLKDKGGSASARTLVRTPVVEYRVRDDKNRISLVAIGQHSSWLLWFLSFGGVRHTGDDQ